MAKHLVALIALAACTGDPGPDTTLLQWLDRGTDDQGLTRIVARGDVLYAADTVNNVYRLVETAGQLTRELPARFPTSWMVELPTEIVVIDNLGVVMASSDGVTFQPRGQTHPSFGLGRRGSELYNVYPVQGGGPLKQVEISRDGGATWTDVPNAMGNGTNVRFAGPGEHALYVTISNNVNTLVLQLADGAVTQVPTVPLGLPTAINHEGVAVRQQLVDETDAFAWAARTGISACAGWRDGIDGFTPLHGLFPMTQRDLVPLGFDGMGRLLARVGTRLVLTAKPLGATVVDDRDGVLQGPGCDDFPGVDPVRGDDPRAVVVTNTSGHDLWLFKFSQLSSSLRRTEDVVSQPLPDGMMTTIQVASDQTWMAFAIDTGVCAGLYRGESAVTVPPL